MEPLTVLHCEYGMGRRRPGKVVVQRMGEYSTVYLLTHSLPSTFLRSEKVLSVCEFSSYAEAETAYNGCIKRIRSKLQRGENGHSLE